MPRKCSSCGNNGHNSRTCSGQRGLESSGGGGGGGLRLFGVQLHVGGFPLKKSFSMECLPSSSSSSVYYAAAAGVAASNPSSSVSSSSSSLVSVEESAERMGNGYLSDGLMGRAQERKKGVPWTEDEHRRFLAGLEKLGKGDWRGISRHFVATRTPTQVASHAQKYFLRQGGLAQKKRRSSLFDVVENGEKAAASAARLRSMQDEAASSVSAMGSRFPALSLGGTGASTTTSRPAGADAVEELLPPCLPLMPISCSPAATTTSATASQSQGTKLPPLFVNHRAPRQQAPDLELKISTAGRQTTDQTGRSSPPPTTPPPFFGTIRVT